MNEINQRKVNANHTLYNGMSWFCCTQAWFFQYFFLTLVSYFHDNDKSLQWWKLHWKKKKRLLLIIVGYTVIHYRDPPWWLLKQSPYHIYNCVYCLVEILPNTNQLLGYQKSSLMIEFRIRFPQRRTDGVWRDWCLQVFRFRNVPWILGVFLEPIICESFHTIPPFHIGKLM